MKHFLNYINGEFVATGKTFENRAPADNHVLGLVHEAGQAEVDAAVRAARAALHGDWGRMTLVKRPSLERQRTLLGVEPLIGLEEGVDRVCREIRRRVLGS